MSYPSAFEISQNVGNRISGAVRKQKDTSAIDEILSGAMQSGKTEDMDAAIGQILSRVSPEKQSMALQILQNKRTQLISNQQYERKREDVRNKEASDERKLQEQRGYNEGKLVEQRDFDRGIRDEKNRLERSALEGQGLDPSLANLPPGVMNTKIKEASKEQEVSKAKEGALDVVNRMKELRSGGNLGWKIGQNLGLGFASGKVRTDRKEYEQLGKSLISFATNIPIRNRLEFETLAENLYDPTMTDAEAAGILNAMERILKHGIITKEENKSVGEKKSLSGIWE